MPALEAAKPHIGICDDCGRRVISGPLLGPVEEVEVLVPDGLSELEAVAYAMSVAQRQLMAPRCRTCLQVR